MRRYGSGGGVVCWGIFGSKLRSLTLGRIAPFRTELLQCFYLKGKLRKKHVFFVFRKLANL